MNEKLSSQQKDGSQCDSMELSIQSSSSPSSTSHTTTATSSDSSSTNGESTIIEEINAPPIETTHGYNSRGHLTSLRKSNMMDTDESGSSSSGNSNSGRTITSSESVKRYKNSPFGLNHHFLTMPDPESVRVTNLSVEATPQQHNTKNRKAKQDWKKRQQPEKIKKIRDHSIIQAKKRDDHLPSNDPYHDLTILAPVSTAFQSPLSSPRWPRDYDEAREISSSDDALSKSQHMSAVENGHGHAAVMTPAFDAGLDAKKCNSKQLSAVSDDYFCNLTERHHETIAHGPGRLNMEEGLVDDKSSSSSYQDYDRLLVRFSSIMYATFLVILGCILHCSELRQKSKNSSDHIYTIVVALIGIAWLLFLQGDLQRYKRYASKYILIESIFNDHRQKMREIGGQARATEPARSTSSSSASLVNDRMSMNTEVIFKKTAYKMYQRRAAALNGQLHPRGSMGKFTSNAAAAAAGANYSSSDLPYQLKSSASTSSSSTSSDQKTKDHPDQRGVEQLVPAYKFLHGKMGANFYLKCGMAAFCFGHVIHEGLRFGQQLYFFGTANVHCRDLAALIAHLITPLYSFYQLFMMFKYSNLVINRHRILAKFGLMHIVGTSITFWIRTILEEAYEDFVHKMDYFKSNKMQGTNLLLSPNVTESTPMAVLNALSSAIMSQAASEKSEQSSVADPQNVTVAQTIWALMSSPISATITPQIARHLPESYACAQNTLLTTKSMNALPYLYPFTIEYNLLLAATFLSLYFNIGKIGPHGAGCQPFTTHSDELEKRTRRPQSRSFSNSPVSHIGLRDNMSTLKVSRKDMGEYKSNFVVNADCHSANKGLFCGFFVLLVTLVTIVIFFVTISKPTHVQLGIKINLIQEGVLTSLILVVMIIGYKQISKLNRSPYSRDRVTTDDVLMLIPLPFFFFHSLLSFRAETASLYQNDLSPGTIISRQFNNEPFKLQETRSSSNQLVNITSMKSISQFHRILSSHRNVTNGQLIEKFINDTSGKTDISGDVHNRGGRGSSNIDAGNDSSQIDHFKLINVALNIVVMIEVLVQTNFIIDGMRRCSESRYLRFKKPGRELITFAILLNITYWIVATFETKSVEQYKPEIEYYGPLPYMFISHTTLPVMLFYRYHSSVCLAEIWNRAYKPPKQR